MCADIHDGQEQQAPFKGPNTDERDQSLQISHIRLATHGRSIQMCQSVTSSVTFFLAAIKLFNHLREGLWRDQGKRDEARELLFPVYGWFTEGLEMRDLKEAKASLDELSL
jgi:hypothetical protein